MPWGFGWGGLGLGLGFGLGYGMWGWGWGMPMGYGYGMWDSPDVYNTYYEAYPDPESDEAISTLLTIGSPDDDEYGPDQDVDEDELLSSE